MSILNYATTLLPSPPPTPASFFSLVSFHPRASTLPFRLPSPPAPLQPPPPSATATPSSSSASEPNQVSDYLLEIDFTCSARFCICTSAPVRRTSAIVHVMDVSSYGALSPRPYPSSSSFVFSVLVTGFIVAHLYVDSADLRQASNSRFLPRLLPNFRQSSATIRYGNAR